LRQPAEEPHQLVDGEREDAEHEVAHDLGMPAHAHEAAAELVLEARVGALGGGALAAAHIYGRTDYENQLVTFFQDIQRLSWGRK
jgi:hypothetical protein